MTVTEHVTALFIGGVYYWWHDDILGAETCWRTAAQILNFNNQQIGVA